MEDIIRQVEKIAKKAWEAWEGKIKGEDEDKSVEGYWEELQKIYQVEEYWERFQRVYPGVERIRKDMTEEERERILRKNLEIIKKENPDPLLEVRKNALVKEYAENEEISEDKAYVILHLLFDRKTGFAGIAVQRKHDFVLKGSDGKDIEVPYRELEEFVKLFD